MPLAITASSYHFLCRKFIPFATTFDSCHLPLQQDHSTCFYMKVTRAVTQQSPSEQNHSTFHIRMLTVLQNTRKRNTCRKRKLTQHAAKLTALAARGIHGTCRQRKLTAPAARESSHYLPLQEGQHQPLKRFLTTWEQRMFTPLISNVVYLSSMQSADIPDSDLASKIWYLADTSLEIAGM